MIKYKNITWDNYQGVLIPLVAPHVKIELSPQETKYLLKQSGAYFIRYCTNWDNAKYNNFWYVIQDKFVDIPQYSSNTRSKIRRGMKNCIVRKINKDEMLKNSYEIYHKSFQRYNTFIKPMSKNDFIKYLKSIGGGMIFLEFILKMAK